MSSGFIPEMHDIGKLVDNKKIESFLRVELDGHYLRTKEGDLDFGAIGVASPSSLTWTGVKHHNDPFYHDLSRSPLSGEDKVNLFLLSLADNLAASSSRAVPPEERGGGVPPLSIPGEATFRKTFTLWRDEHLPKGQPDNWSPIQDKTTLREMFILIDQAQDAREFFDKYDDPQNKNKQYLCGIPEDKSPHRAVTSLRTHLELTGKFFRILKEHVRPDDIENPKGLIYASLAPISHTAQAKERWEFSFVRCMVRFPQAIVRARDLNVFCLLEQLMGTLEDPLNPFSKYVLFRTTETLWLFLPTDGTVNASQILRPLLEQGFYAEVDRAQFVLRNLHPDLRTWFEEYDIRVRKGLTEKQERMRRECTALKRHLVDMNEKIKSARAEDKAYLGQQISHKNRQIRELKERLEEIGHLQNKRQATFESIKTSAKCRADSLFSEEILSAPIIEDPICELCQSRPADSKPWRSRDEDINEYLCKKCQKIRNEGQRFGKISGWEEAGGETRLAWVKVSVDYDHAYFLLRLLFEDYIDKLVDKFGGGSLALAEDLKLNFRPVAPLADFAKDYRKMLERLSTELEGIFSTDRIEEINATYKDFYIIKLDSDNEALEIVNAFERCLADQASYFPRLRDDSPIKLSISMAPVKFPFFEHWRYLCEPRATVNLQVPGSVRLEVDFAKFADLRSIRIEDKRIGALLHRLVDIEISTRSKLLVEVELLREANKFPDLVNLYRLGRLTSEEILGYYKIARG